MLRDKRWAYALLTFKRRRRVNPGGYSTVSWDAHTSRLWEGVRAFEKVGFESQLWFWIGAKAEIWRLGPHFQD